MYIKVVCTFQLHQRWIGWLPGPVLLAAPAEIEMSTEAAGPHWALRSHGRSFDEYILIYIWDSINYVLTLTKENATCVMFPLCPHPPGVPCLKSAPSYCTYQCNLYQVSPLWDLPTPIIQKYNRSSERIFIWSRFIQMTCLIVQHILPLWSHRWLWYSQPSPEPSRLLWIWSLDRKKMTPRRL